VDDFALAFLVLNAAAIVALLYCDGEEASLGEMSERA
jgi:hypothetical protein